MRIDIFSGFLGAGKTTLIKKLIKEAYAGEKLVLIENEFGEIGIDGGFMKDAGIEIREMNSGCICCSLVGDFSKALRQVYDTYSPDRIIIEPSGVGKLSDVTGAVLDADLPDAKITSCTTVVNAAKCKMYMKNFGEFFNNQIENATCIVLSHTEALSDAKTEEAVALVKGLNPNAQLVTTPLDKISGKQILAAMEASTTLADELHALEEEVHHHHHGEGCHCGHDHHEHHHGEECHCGHDHHEHHHDEECHCGHGHHEHHHGEECHCGHDHHEHHHGEECHCGHDHHEHHHDEGCCCGHGHHEHHHDEGCCCGHDHHHHHDHHADEVFTSWGKETTKKYTAERIDEILKNLDSCEKYGTILRAKGIVAGEDGWIHFDYIPGGIDVRTGSAETIGRLCVIGCELDEAALAELFGL